MYMHVCCIEGEAASASKRVSWQDRELSPTREVVPPFATFTGSERQLALKLCGWSFGNDGQGLEDYLKRYVMSVCVHSVPVKIVNHCSTHCLAIIW